MSNGVFQDMVEIVNRAPVSITVQFDGQSHTIPPGKSSIPRVTVQYAKNQNPLKGSADLSNPTISGLQFLLGVVGSADDCEPLTPEEWTAHLGSPSRFNIDDIMELAERRLKPGEHMIVKKAPKQSRFTVALNTPMEFGGGE